MNRRSFLESTAKSLTFLTLSPYLPLNAALASSAEKRFFVQISILGGWDVTLGTDPWLKTRLDPSEIFIEYTENEVRKSNEIFLGPGMQALAPYTKNAAVINGIFLSAQDNGHDAAYTYMLTGTTDSNWGSLTVEYAEAQPETALGVVGNSSAIVGSRSTMVSSASTLKKLRDIKYDDILPTPGSSETHSEKIDKTLFSSAEKIKVFTSTLKDFENAGIEIDDKVSMAASLKAELTYMANYQAISGFLDTHANHVGTHLRDLSANWSEIAKLFEIFKMIPFGPTGESLFDRTTFQIVSEFSRTAALNPAGGKDHNPICNSSVLVDSRLKSTTVGGSHVILKNQSKTGQSYHIASPIDLATGQATMKREGSFIIRPENVGATIFDLLGVSRKRIPSISAKTCSLIHLIK